MVVLNKVTVLPELSFMFFQLPIVSPSRHSFQIIYSGPRTGVINVNQTQDFPTSSTVLKAYLSAHALHSQAARALGAANFPFIYSPVGGWSNV